MNRQSRLSAILSVLSEKGSLDVEDASSALKVSSATIRRDFDSLAERQLLTRTHGGAISTNSSYELPLSYKIVKNSEGKQRIARTAAALVSRGNVIGFNGGTTTTEVARAIANRPEFNIGPNASALTVVTNALNIAVELIVRQHIKLVVTGGVVRPESYELAGPFAAPILDELLLDIVFLGVVALDPVQGALADHEDEALVNRHIASRARRVIVVADSSKLGARAFACISPTNQIDQIITDAALPEKIANQFRDAGVEIVVAK